MANYCQSLPDIPDISISLPLDAGFKGTTELRPKPKPTSNTTNTDFAKIIATSTSAAPFRLAQLWKDPALKPFQKS